MSHPRFRTHRPLYTNVIPRAVEKPKMKWRILPILWLAIKRIASALGFLILINIALAIFVYPALFSSKDAAPALPDEMVLFLKFEDGFLETPSPVSFADPFAADHPTVRDIINGIDNAAIDPRVKGIVARMYDGNFSMTHITEIRMALKRFRDTGKFAHIYSSSYGEGGSGMSRYYLASAFDEVWMQPLGIVSITGAGAEVPFFRKTLDKIGITPQFFQRKEYKNAYESVTSKQMSAQNREKMSEIIADVRSSILERVPAERGMSPAAFEALVNKGLFTAPEAAAAGLITHMDYGDVLMDNVAEAVTGKRDVEELNFIAMDRYINTKKKAKPVAGKAAPKVALIYAVGAIMPDGEGGGLPSASGVAAADKIAPAILAASRDDDVKAIVLRIDSPGGSPSASESILRAVEKAKMNGKPVIVSMGSMAASGGYWIAAYADKIYALPNTLTGSIGVLGGKFIFGDLFDKVGVNWESVTWGANADMWSINQAFDASQIERMNAMFDHIYDSFVARVAKGRNMTPEAVDAIAGGRVWTGRRALKVGLVDELGGLENAMDHVAGLTKVKSRSDLNIVVYPKPKTALEQIVQFLDQQGGAVQGAQTTSQILERAAPALEMLNVIERPQDYSVFEPMRVQ